MLVSKIPSRSVPGEKTQKVEIFLHGGPLDGEARYVDAFRDMDDGRWYLAAVYEFAHIPSLFDQPRPFVFDYKMEVAVERPRPRNLTYRAYRGNSRHYEFLEASDATS